MKKISLLINLSAFVLLSFHSLAEPQELSLSEDQRASLSKIRDQYRGEIQAKRKMIHSKQEVLKKALESEVKEPQLLSLFEALQSEKQELARVRFEELLKMRAVLRPDQRHLLKRLKKSKSLRNP